MIRNSLNIYASLIVQLSLWPLRVLILGYLINDIKNDIKNDNKNDIRYSSTDGQLVGPSARLRAYLQYPFVSLCSDIPYSKSHTNVAYEHCTVNHINIDRCQASPLGAPPGYGRGSTIGERALVCSLQVVHRHSYPNTLSTPTVSCGKLRLSLQLVPTSALFAGS